MEVWILDYRTILFKKSRVGEGGTFVYKLHNEINAECGGGSEN